MDMATTFLNMVVTGFAFGLGFYVAQWLMGHILK